MELIPQAGRWHFDEPFADSSALPTYCLARATRRHVTVALTGDGGDELFAGYDRYRAMQLAASIDRLPPVRGLFGSHAWQRLPSGGRQKGFFERAKRLSNLLAIPSGRRYAELISIFSESQPRGAV